MTRPGLTELTKYGFIHAGFWATTALKSGIGHSINEFLDERVIYAFVTGQDVRYIGVCADRSLKERMSSYQNQGGQPKGGSTNISNAQRIRTCLEGGTDVGIWALRPNPTPQPKYHDLAVDLVAGLERSLIEKFQPDWNTRGLRKDATESGRAA